LLEIIIYHENYISENIMLITICLYPPTTPSLRHPPIMKASPPPKDDDDGDNHPVKKYVVLRTYLFHYI
jgi:hypothetical protein